MYGRYMGNIKIVLLILLIYIYNKKFKNNKFFIILTVGFTLSSYILTTKLEHKTWNPKIISSSVYGILKEAKKLNQIEYIKLKRND
ncbi:MAG: hypothetical protein ACRC6E_02405 [Fusobacteriaceae bacterium]